MSLRLKFSFVLSLLVFTIAVNVVLSVWSIRFLERELSWPLRYAQPVLIKFHSIKRIGEDELKALGAREEKNTYSDQAISDISNQVLNLEHEAIREFEDLKSLPTVRVRSGGSTSDNLHRRSKLIIDTLNSWTETKSSSQYKALINHIHERHELIERVEGRILQDAGLAADYGSKLQFVIYTIIATSLSGAIACVIYAAILIRRWIIQPVGQLREATQLFGMGDFEHRVHTDSDDELGLLGDEFNHMASLIYNMQKEKIEKARLAAMGEMAQRTVHNLRTPLAGIRALAETTKNELDPDSDLRDIQGRILSTIDRFESWLQSMLRVSAPLELQYLEYEPTQLIQLVTQNHRDAARARGITLNTQLLESDLHAIGDAHHLEHAITAILSNAIDFSPDDETIQIHVDQEDGYWTLEITDRGLGIKPELHESIFRPYFTTRKSGTGIGLAMVKRIMKQHHGEIIVKSPIDPDSSTGTTIVLKIPIQAGENM
ncbi:MAG: HAMP domain-containing sensor histidine kinase [Phycisphaerales bacterium]|nr:HAMP domain-containing sensor histidine kinase [Phycisphaerales bacterium]